MVTFANLLLKQKKKPLSDSIVLIPTYNEIENVEAIIRKTFSFSDEPSEVGKYFEILIIDDGSPDGTAEAVKKLQEEFPARLHLMQRQGKQGLGTAYIAGFKWGLEREYEYFFEMDADFSHNPKDLIRLHAACHKEGGDVAIGSRYIKGVNVVNWPMSRVLLSYFASRYVRIILRIPFQDTTAGFMCYHRKVLKRMNFKSIKFVGYAFQIEMKYIAYKLGFKVTEIPVIFTDRARGNSKMSNNIIREAVFGVLQLKMRNLLKRYK